MAGAPSQLDLYDYKPGLGEKFKQPLPAEIRDGQRVTAMTRNAAHLIQPSMFKFAPQGRSGLHMSELLPHLSGVADELFDLAPKVAANKRVAYPQGSHANNDGCRRAATLLELRFVQDLPHAHVAEVLGVSLRTAKHWAGDALTALRAELERRERT